ncbi:calcium-binding protein [Streptomyces cucumeris]|uniref:calcium-binding protein n=1 Tax=Streptomyces cucumeris TaxID=2962890 RepID=UPI0020C89921|nr:calcium-binding protein [Streptomyces sp. NEAU-Y11]MCP9206074.1 calcium-binding protein [Streptomyces sp. NEAU-Y11]
MRKRATMAAIASAVALSVLVVPDGAQADEVVGDTTMDVVINGGSDIVLGTTKPKTFTIAVTATDDSGIKEDYNVPALWYGPGPKGPDDPYGLVVPDNGAGDCVAHNATTTTCTFIMTMNPRIEPQDNTTAGTWKLTASATGNDWDHVHKDIAATVKVRRYAKLTVNASPEPVKKGKSLAVTGNLTRASWESYRYAGYAGQPVKLQFRKKGTNTYTTVKTVSAGRGGALKTAVKAAADGYWRWSFSGTSTTSTATAPGDYVDVR